MDAAREELVSLLGQILEDADWAPPHKLTQPWRFHVFQTADAQMLPAATFRSARRTRHLGLKQTMRLSLTHSA